VALSPELLAILVCPACKGALTYDAAANTLTCPACRLRYKVVEEHPGHARGRGREPLSRPTLVRTTFRLLRGPLLLALIALVGVLGAPFGPGRHRGAARRRASRARDAGAVRFTIAVPEPTFVRIESRSGSTDESCSRASVRSAIPGVPRCRRAS
jgi:hypothetical protein